jgi:hypothetical protein
MERNSFDIEADEERAFYDSLDIAEMHTLIYERKFGRTGAFWQSLRARTTLPQSAWVLMEMLERRSVNRDARVQAANVLLHLLDSHDWSAETLADDRVPDFEDRLRELRRLVNERIRATMG